jgi:hypothetical protein
MISTNAAPLRFGHSLEEIDGRLELLGSIAGWYLHKR